MTRSSRRGANALEFALVMPVLTTMLLGTMDYGWYFLRAWYVTSAVHEAVRFGSVQVPAEDEKPGQCAACVDSASRHAAERLAELGLKVDSRQLKASIVAIEGTCALTMRTELPHEALVGFVPLPDQHTADAVWLLSHVNGC
jgi:hypothetical protein